MILKGHSIDIDKFLKKYNLPYTGDKEDTWGSKQNYTKEVDFGILTNNKTMEQYSSKMKFNRDITFNFYLLDKSFGDRNIVYIPDFKPENNNEVSIVFHGNFAYKDFLPFTPWILMHRSFHAISQFSKDNGENNFNKIMSIGDRIIFELAIQELNFLAAQKDNYHDWNYLDAPACSSSMTDELKYRINGKQEDYIKYMFPFRSARNNLRLISLDLVCEFFAQKCMLGKIKFFDVNKIPNEIIPQKNKSLLNERYNEQANKIDRLYEDIFNLIGGNVYYF